MDVPPSHNICPVRNVGQAEPGVIELCCTILRLQTGNIIDLLLEVSEKWT